MAGYSVQEALRLRVPSDQDLGDWALFITVLAAVTSAGSACLSVLAFCGSGLVLILGWILCGISALCSGALAILSAVAFFIAGAAAFATTGLWWSKLVLGTSSHVLLRISPSFHAWILQKSRRFQAAAGFISRLPDAPLEQSSRYRTGPPHASPAPRHSLDAQAQQLGPSIGKCDEFQVWTLPPMNDADSLDSLPERTTLAAAQASGLQVVQHQDEASGAVSDTQPPTQHRPLRPDVGGGEKNRHVHPSAASSLAATTIEASAAKGEVAHSKVDEPGNSRENVSGREAMSDVTTLSSASATSNKAARSKKKKQQRKLGPTGISQ